MSPTVLLPVVGPILGAALVILGLFGVYEMAGRDSGDRTAQTETQTSEQKEFATPPTGEGMADTMPGPDGAGTPSDDADASGVPDDAVASAPEAGDPSRPDADGAGEPARPADSGEATSPSTVAGEDQPPAGSPAEPGTPSTAPAPPDDVAEYDVVQVFPDGRVVVAGRTEPEAVVELLSDDEVIASERASPRGEFVLVPDVRLSPGTRRLSLSVQTPDAPGRRQTSRTVLAVVPDRAGGTTEPPVALLVDEEGEVLRRLDPGGEPGEETPLFLLAVTFDEAGNASIAGGGEPGQRVTVYLNNEPVGSAIVGDEGHWTVRPPEPLSPTESYEVRVDQTAPGDDAVTERILTTLVRAGGHLIPASATVVTVEQGMTLWGISRSHYGRGILYTLIYNSNSYQIADPHWIYPGQQFIVPSQN